MFWLLATESQTTPKLNGFTLWHWFGSWVCSLGKAWWARVFSALPGVSGKDLQADGGRRLKTHSLTLSVHAVVIASGKHSPSQNNKYNDEDSQSSHIWKKNKSKTTNSSSVPYTMPCGQQEPKPNLLMLFLRLSVCLSVCLTAISCVPQQPCYKSVFSSSFCLVVVLKLWENKTRSIIHHSTFRIQPSLELPEIWVACQLLFYLSVYGSACLQIHSLPVLLCLNSEGRFQCSDRVHLLLEGRNQIILLLLFVGSLPAFLSQSHPLG